MMANFRLSLRGIGDGLDDVSLFAWWLQVYGYKIFWIATIFWVYGNKISLVVTLWQWGSVRQWFWVGPTARTRKSRTSIQHCWRWYILYARMPWQAMQSIHCWVDSWLCSPLLWTFFFFFLMGFVVDFLERGVLEIGRERI